MNSSCSVRAFTIATLCVLASGKNFAQLPTADLTRIVPRAAVPGHAVEVSLSGQNLEEVTELRFTHPGLSAEPILLTTDEFFPEPRINGNRFNVTVDDNVPPGIYEARAVGYFGLSTARPFVVARDGLKQIASDGKHTSRDSALQLTVNSVVSGDIPGRGLHWFTFSAKAGQRVLIELTAERIDSRLDGQLIVYARDGRELKRNRDWFGRDSFVEVQPESDGQYFVSLSDILFRGGGDYFYRLRISDQPHVDFIWPPMGEPGSTSEYAVYGRNLPGGVRDESVVVDGLALEKISQRITLPNDLTTPTSFHPGQPRQGMLPGHDIRLPFSNDVRVGYATASVVMEQESTTSIEHSKGSQGEAQTVSVPCEVAGRFDYPNDEDTFRFAAKKDVTYFIETIADRMAFPVDPYVLVEKIVTSADGSEVRTQITDNDDMPSFFSIDGKDSVNADTTDAALNFTADADADYSVTIVNQFGDGGARQMYRLAIRQQTPDFQLIATTERPLPTNRTGYSVTPHLRQGARWGIRIICPRQDDFQGDIVVSAKGLPPGVTAQPLILSGRTDRGVLVVTAEDDAASWSGEFQIEGNAETNGKSVRRQARFASLVWGHIFADSIRVRSRLTERIPLSVNGSEIAPVRISPAEDREWTVEMGQQLDLPIKITNTGSRSGTLTIEPHGLFGMVRSPPTVNVGENETDATLTINFAPNGNFEVQPGRYQFCLLGTGVAKYRHNYAASVRAEADRLRIEKLAADIAASDAAAKVAVSDAKQRVEKLKTKLSSATDDETKANLTDELKTASAVLNDANMAAKAASARVKAAEAAKKQIVKAAKDTATKAAEKDTKFAAWSDLITVVVKPKAE